MESVTNKPTYRVFAFGLNRPKMALLPGDVTEAVSRLGYTPKSIIINPRCQFLIKEAEELGITVKQSAGVSSWQIQAEMKE